MSAPTLTEPAPLPVDVREMLVDRAALLCAAEGYTSVAWFPAGRHSEAMSPADWARRGVSVRCLVDDFATGERHGLPVLRPEDVTHETGIDAVVVSSDASEDSLAERARAWAEPLGIPVVRIYGRNIAQPDPTDLDRAVYDQTLEALYDDTFNIKNELRRMALRSTAEFVRDNIPIHLARPSRFELLDHALSLAPTDGLHLEFGVYRAITINRMAAARPETAFYGFDSFEPLPEPWIFRKKAFGDLPNKPAVRDNVTLVEGWFDRTLPPFLADHAGPVAMVHIDCDLCSSTRTALEHIAPRLTEGTVVVFDEYFNYPGWEHGEHKAWTELVERTGLRFEYVGFTARVHPAHVRRREGHSGCQVAVRVLDPGDAGADRR